MSIKATKASIGERARVIGNVSASRTPLFGTPASMKAEAKNVFLGGVNILAPGCRIAIKTQLANLRAP